MRGHTRAAHGPTHILIRRCTTDEYGAGPTENDTVAMLRQDYKTLATSLEGIKDLLVAICKCLEVSVPLPDGSSSHALASASQSPLPSPVANLAGLSFRKSSAASSTGDSIISGHSGMSRLLSHMLYTNPFIVSIAVRARLLGSVGAGSQQASRSASHASSRGRGPNM